MINFIDKNIDDDTSDTVYFSSARATTFLVVYMYSILRYYRRLSSLSSSVVVCRGYRLMSSAIVVVAIVVTAPIVISTTDVLVEVHHAPSFHVVPSSRSFLTLSTSLRLNFTHTFHPPPPRLPIFFFLCRRGRLCNKPSLRISTVAFAPVFSLPSLKR